MYIVSYRVYFEFFFSFFTKYEIRTILFYSRFARWKFKDYRGFIFFGGGGPGSRGPSLPLESGRHWPRGFFGLWRTLPNTFFRFRPPTERVYTLYRVLRAYKILCIYYRYVIRVYARTATAATLYIAMCSDVGSRRAGGWAGGTTVGGGSGGGGGGGGETAAAAAGGQDYNRVSCSSAKSLTYVNAEHCNWPLPPPPPPLTVGSSHARATSARPFRVSDRRARKRTASGPREIAHPGGVRPPETSESFHDF